MPVGKMNPGTERPIKVSTRDDSFAHVCGKIGFSEEEAETLKIGNVMRVNHLVALMMPKYRKGVIDKLVEAGTKPPDQMDYFIERCVNWSA